MQSLYFVNWIVMTMDQNMIEALSLTAQQISSPETLGALSPLLFFYHSLLCSLFALLFPSVDQLCSYPLNQVVLAKVENNIHYYNHLCLISSQMYNLKVIEHHELVCLQYVIHCKNTKLSMRIYKHHQGSTRIYKLYNFLPPESLFE